MGWPTSLVIAFLGGALGLVCAGGIAQLCVGWYRISSFEGASGYFVVFTALLGGLASFVLGLVVTRRLPTETGFWTGSGAALGAIVFLALVALALCRGFADPDPTLDGKDVELEIEVRCPVGFELPEPDSYGATAGIHLPAGRRLPTGALRLDEGALVDGRRVLPAVVPLTTRSAHKYLSVRFDAEVNLLFALPLRPRPQAADREWSDWIESGWDVGKPQPPAEARFHMRYRVRTVEPPPPEPDAVDVRAQEFAALEPDAPLERWLPFLFESPSDERTRVVLQRIEERQAELALLVRSTDATLREHALRATKYPAQPVPEIIEAVLAEGRSIADGLRRVNELPDEDPLVHTLLDDLRTRFHEWKHAWWGLSQRLGLDGRPPVREIHALAGARPRGMAMNEIEVGARVILQALDASAASAAADAGDAGDAEGADAAPADAGEGADAADAGEDVEGGR